MKKLSFLEEYGNDHLDVNGQIFKVEMTAADLYNIPLDLRSAFLDFNEKANQKQEFEKLSAFIESLYDRMLGAGAYVKIFGGKDVPLNKKVQHMVDIYEAIADLHIEGMAKEYE